MNTGIKSNINFLMLIRVIGWLLIIESCFMLIPLFVSLFNEQTDLFSFIISILITGVSGVVATRVKPKSREIGKRDAVLLTASVWIFFSIFGMIPFMIYGSHKTITDAFFETMSGFTTSGATLIDAAYDLPKGIILWRSLIQWIGGMGIIIFTLSILPMLNYQGGIQLFNAEVSGITSEKLRPRVSSTAKSLWLIYMALTFILIVLLVFSDMSIYEAICHSFSIMSTGGFSTTDFSLDNWNSSYIKIVSSIFMFLGGVNFALLYKIFTGKFRGILNNDALKWYLYAIIISYVLILLNIVCSKSEIDIVDVTINPLYVTISILSTAGVTQPDIINWNPSILCVVFIMLFVGACAGSTSGGAKIDRLILVLKFIKNEFYKMLHHNTVTTVRINGNGTPTAVLQKALAFLFIYILVIFIGGMLLTLTGVSFGQSFLYSLSFISNSCININMTGFDMPINLISDSAKWILSAIMLIGRLELFTVLLLFTPYFWKK